MLTTKYPSYPDYMHHQHTGSMTAWTDSYYDAANEFEKDIQEFVFHGLSTLLKCPILQKWQKKLNIFTSVIANFIRVAPKVINLQKLIREACPKSTHVIKLCMNHRGSQAQHRDAELEREAVFEFLKANDPIDEEQWDKEIYPDGAPIKYERMKDFCKKLLLYTDEANDKHKRLFDIYGGFSPAEPEEFMPVLYALMCNVHVLVEITKFLKTSGSNHSLWISKTKPKGFLAKLEKAEQRIIGFLYKRSKAFNVLLAEYTKHADPTSQPDCYKFRILQQTVPDGWDKTSRESLPGNTVDNGQFSLMARRVAHELTMFCRQDSKFPDVRALACFTDLLDVLENPCIPNPAFAILTILKVNHDHPREKMKMKARKKLAKLEYDPACWIDDFLAALLNWQVQAKEIGENITDEDLYKKFQDSFVIKWIHAKGTNSYQELLIELAKIWNKIKNKEPQPAADQKLVEALTNFTTLRTFANSIRSEYEESGIQMKKAPEYYWDTGYYPTKKGGNVKVDLDRSLKTLEIEDQEPESRHEAQNVNADELRIQSLVNAPRNSPILPMPTPQIKKDDIFIDSPPCQEMTPPNHKPLTSSARRSKSRKRRSSGGTINRTLNARIEDSIVDHDNLESVLPDSD